MNNPAVTPAIGQESALADHFQITSLEPRHEASSYNGNTDGPEIEHGEPTYNC